mgnify:CR=1 FL=1
MHIFQLRHLRKFCTEHGIDFQEVDYELTYWENLKHLRSLTLDLGTNLDEWESREEEYMRNHFLWYYIGCIREGKNRSAEVGKPDKSVPQFSLKAFVVTVKQQTLPPFSMCNYEMNRLLKKQLKKGTPAMG